MEQIDRSIAPFDSREIAKRNAQCAGREMRSISRRSCDRNFDGDPEMYRKLGLEKSNLKGSSSRLDQRGAIRNRVIKLGLATLLIDRYA